MYINESNGSVSSVLTDDRRSYRDQLRRMLGFLDGGDDFSYSIWHVPDDAGWPDAPGYRDSDWDGEYLQSAGDAQRMAIELRRREQDGAFHQYVVGRRDDDAEAPDELVHYAEHALMLRPTEVFDAEAAADVYFHYFQTHTVPADLRLRELDLS